MKRLILTLCVCVMLAPAIAGCSKKDSPDEGDAAYERMKKETGEAAEATRGYVSQKRDEFMANMQSNLDELTICPCSAVKSLQTCRA